MPHKTPSNPRRQFLRQSAAATGLLLAPGLIGCNSSGPASAGEDPEPAPRRPDQGRKLGIAILGLGGYASGQIAPALQLTEHCELRGLITGSPEKLPEWQRKYNIKKENSYTYDTMDEIADNAEIDVIYVITPTATHRDFSVRAANAGKHVWCEKPMAMTPEECQEMIDACNRNGVKLAIGYRMMHEPNTRKLIELTKEKAYGPLTGAHAYAGYAGSPPPADYWRGQRDMGGGALYDMGVYTVNGLAYGTQLQPVAVVKAEQRRQDRPNGVDLTTTYTLRYPDGMTAEGKTSVVEDYNELHIDAENGWYEMDPMQPYTGVKGSTSDGKVLGPPVPNQQSIQMDDDALAILNGTELIAPGTLAKHDIRVIRAIIESAETGREVKI
ncbi:glucose-fructose oxidoreductase [Lewinella marina]|uniref:Glucose-fructose oxidoreductase n=1 Tax=Neolewinella marina TaxID=438751 RepID=A0A2G0CCJ3_9BACT|nr:Gfo/Idh/MocA family oxidoreductase [Neolewinella marina]NJB87621.1 glucose-fructose oxidoreductase [Neolewinella marina]PHK97691.1 glucose-fructose oxidoreductase [Neolewinella marina]